MQSEVNLRQMSKLLVSVWLLVGFAALCFVATALSWADPLERADVVLVSIFAATFAGVPFAVAWATLRARTWFGVGWSVSGLMVWSATLSWVFTNG